MKLIVLYNDKLKDNKMARVTSEKAAAKAGSRYELILIAAARARELKRGHQPLVDKDGGNIVTALREIEEGKIDVVEYLAKAGR
jgi:DNA-directed RNA polymerase subunit omega